MKVTLREPQPRPMWLSPASLCTFYRETLPAQMTGGSVRTTLPLVMDGEFVELDFDALESLARLDTAEHIIIPPMNLGNPVVFRMPAWRAEGLLRFVQAINDAGGNIWIDTDDEVSTVPMMRAWLTLHVRRMAGNRARRQAVNKSPEEIYNICAETERDMEATTLSLARAHAELTGTFYRSLVRAARGVIVATDPLASDVADLGVPVVVFPNVVDPEHMPPVTRPDDGIVRVGFGGSLLHYDVDVPPVMPALLDLARRRSDVELHFFGRHPCDRYYLRNHRRAGVYQYKGVPYHYHPLVGNILAYHRNIGILDIAIAPLVDAHFNRCRSASKWMEHALHETAMVASDLPPYAPVEDGRTGLKAARLEDFGPLVERLVDDRELRRRIGAAARQEVLRNHSVTARQPAWLEWAESARQLQASGKALHM